MNKKRKARQKQEEFGECLSCGTPLIESGGFHGTGLCGPCCTGESSTIGMLSAEDPGNDDHANPR